MTFKKTTVYGLIPAKKNSERLKNKNLLKVFKSETLLSVAIKEAFKSDNIDKIYDTALECGALGGKLTGAGGGGHMIFYCEKTKQNGFIEKMNGLGLKHIKFKFNKDGLKVLDLYDYSKE